MRLFYSKDFRKFTPKDPMHLVSFSPLNNMNQTYDYFPIQGEITVPRIANFLLKKLRKL